MGQSVEGQSILELIVILYLHRTSWAIYIFLAVNVNVEIDWQDLCAK